jgi:hypothetical protein
MSEDIDKFFDSMREYNNKKYYQSRNFALRVARDWISDPVFRRNVIKLLEGKKIRVENDSDFENDLLSFGCRVDRAAKNSDETVTWKRVGDKIVSVNKDNKTTLK